jgi:hypothetical protein
MAPHLGMFIQVCLGRAWEDLFVFHLFSHSQRLPMQGEGQVCQNIKPGIFCSFHLFSYRHPQKPEWLPIQWGYFFKFVLVEEKIVSVVHFYRYPTYWAKAAIQWLEC